MVNFAIVATGENAAAAAEKEATIRAEFRPDGRRGGNEAGGERAFGGDVKAEVFARAANERGDRQGREEAEHDRDRHAER